MIWLRLRSEFQDLDVDAAYTSGLKKSFVYNRRTNTTWEPYTVVFMDLSLSSLNDGLIYSLQTSL